MKIKSFLFLLLFLFPTLCFANAGWPAMWVIAGASVGLQKFWLLVLLCLVIETYVLKKQSSFSLLKSAILIITANLASAAVGVAMIYPLLFTDALFEKASDPGIVAYFTDVILIFTVSVFVEALIVRFFLKTTWKKLFSILVLSNFVTHILGIIYIYFSNK